MSKAVIIVIFPESIASMMSFVSLSRGQQVWDLHCILTGLDVISI